MRGNLRSLKLTVAGRPYATIEPVATPAGDYVLHAGQRYPMTRDYPLAVLLACVAEREDADLIFLQQSPDTLLVWQAGQPGLAQLFVSNPELPRLIVRLQLATRRNSVAVGCDVPGVARVEPPALPPVVQVQKFRMQALGALLSLMLLAAALVGVQSAIETRASALKRQASAAQLEIADLTKKNPQALAAPAATRPLPAPRQVFTDLPPRPVWKVSNGLAV